MSKKTIFLFTSIVIICVAVVGFFVFRKLTTPSPSSTGEVLGIVEATPDSSQWVPGANVTGLAVAADGTQYIGGSFTGVGPNNGGFGIPVSTATGSPVATFPLVADAVRAVVSDGSGGWFIGGDFRQVGGTARNYIAHISSNGTLDATWNPNANGTIYALVLSGSTLYVAGEFTYIGEEARNYVAALSTSTGNATSWNPDPDSSVYTMALTGSTLYIGGAFSYLTEGGARGYVAAVNTSTGVATSWNPDLDDIVLSLFVSGTTLYVGGYFTCLDSSDTCSPTRSALASFNTTTGAVNSWDPNAEDYTSVDAFAIYDTTLYVGGTFSCFNACGTERNGIAAFNTATGSLTNWDPNAGAGFSVSALLPSSDGNIVYVGGTFTSIGGATRLSIAALNASDGLATSWDPKAAGGQVFELALSGTTLYLGGSFSTIGSSVVVRNRIAAIDPSTGQAKTSFSPLVIGAGQQVHGLVLTADDVSLYVGGNFTTIGGQARTSLAKVTTSDGSIAAWTGNNHGLTTIKDMILSGTTLYVAGYGKVLSMDTTQNDTVNWTVAITGGIPSEALSLTLVGTTLYVGGSFTTIGGQARNRIAALNATTGAVLAWDPNADGIVESIVKSANGATLYVGGSFQNISSTARNRLASFTVADGLITSWNPNMNGTVLSLALSSSHLYAGGKFTSAGGSTRNRLATFDIADMSLTTWAPSLNSADTTTSTINVTTIASNGTSVYTGGNFTIIGTTVRPYYAVYTESESNPTIQFTATTSSGSEATTSVTLQLELSEARGSGDATVDYAVTG
ncbi:MAG: hypothetical protein UV70_C0008G0001, partial [Parcubacteria group bacterium GW2011_GWA2_43_13]